MSRWLERRDGAGGERNAPLAHDTGQSLFTASTIATDATQGIAAIEHEFLSSAGDTRRQIDSDDESPGFPKGPAIGLRRGPSPPPPMPLSHENPGLPHSRQRPPSPSLASSISSSPSLPPPPRPRPRLPPPMPYPVPGRSMPLPVNPTTGLPYVNKVQEWRQEMEAAAANTAPSGQPEKDTQETDTDTKNVMVADATSMTSALGTIAQQYLNLDVLGGSNDTSQYIGFLLDTIHRLQSRVNFLSVGDPGSDSDTSDAGSIAEVDKQLVAQARYQVLYRVFCGNASHFHDLQVYEDEPALTVKQWSREEFVSGKDRISDIKVYLRNNPEVKFIIFKESICIPEWDKPKPRTHDKWFINAKNFDRQTKRISHRNERLKITCPVLQEAVEQVATGMIDWVDFGSSQEMDAPYHFFFHHREKLRELGKTTSKYEETITMLLNYLEESFSVEYSEADELMQRRIMSESHIEKLYKTGQLVVTKEGEQIPIKCLDEWPRRELNFMRFSGWSWTYDGRRLQREKWFKGVEINMSTPKDIQKLPIYPLEFLDDDARSKLEETGRKFWALRLQRLVTYNGWDKHRDYSYFNERFMVDMMTYSRMYSSAYRGASRLRQEEAEPSDEMPSSISNDQELTTNQLLLLPSSTYGYSLREKKWVSIYVDQTSEVVWNKKAFDLLVLEEETKSLLRALIDVRMSKAKTFDDIVAGKGNGLVMLLHGSPGTGKSLTAESVAEFAGKPLYRVTCGDIGTEPVEVEQYLNTIFYLGKTWDCVLLLDEADVFLEERSVNDLQRNSLVSIFLRGLELYEGIIILTSNRVGTFDEAFQSRIRFALRYEPLGKRSRRAIWNNLFNMLLDDDNEINVNIPNLDRRLDELALYEVNGRQIRNALLTARQLALHRQESLEWSHLMQVLKLSDKFNKYLKEVKGHSDEDWAKSQALR